MKQTKSEILFYLVIVVLLLILGSIARGQNSSEIVASGGQFTLEKQVVAGGGNQMSQAGMNQSGTGGQTIAGTRSNGGSFSLYSGFWTPEDFTPTAATAVIGGQIRAADGRGIKKVIVTLIFPSGASQRAVSSNFGYYHFAEIPVGVTYIVSVAAKRFTFSQSAQIVSLSDDATDIDFTADALSLQQFP